MGRSDEVDRAIRVKFGAGSLTPMRLRFSDLNGGLIFKCWAYAIEPRFTSGTCSRQLTLLKEKKLYSPVILRIIGFLISISPPMARVAAPVRALWPNLRSVPLLPQMIH
jgi:hypothetical protein